MYAYATKATAVEAGDTSCMLLYPEMLLEYSGDLTFETPEPGEIPLFIRSIRLSHNLLEKEGLNALKQELKGILTPLLPREEPVETGVE